MKIFIQYTDNRFISNLVLNQIPGLDLLSGVCKNSLYKIHHQFNPNSYVFSVTNIDTEIRQFIEEYDNQVKIFIYHDTFTDQYHDSVSMFPRCTHLSHQKISQNNVVIIPDLLNQNIFHNLQLARNDSILFFMDDMMRMPENLSSILYPKSKIKLKMFGGYTSHNQNLGTVTEREKATLLNKNKYYLSINGYYESEAIACGCEIYTLNDLLENKSPQIPKQLKPIEYSDFIISILT